MHMMKWLRIICSSSFDRMSIDMIDYKKKPRTCQEGFSTFLYSKVSRNCFALSVEG